METFVENAVRKGARKNKRDHTPTVSPSNVWFPGLSVGVVSPGSPFLSSRFAGLSSRFAGLSSLTVRGLFVGKKMPPAWFL